MQRDHLLLTMAYKRAGSFTVAMQAFRYLVEYGRANDDTGELLNVEQYAEHVKVSLSQAYRRRAAFKTCFPKDDVMDLWRIVKPILDASNFKNEHPRAQAVFVSSIRGTFTS